MCDVIKIRLKRIATRSGKGNQPLNIKTSVERPILELGLPNFMWSFYFILLLVAHDTFQRFKKFDKKGKEKMNGSCTSLNSIDIAKPICE